MGLHAVPLALAALLVVSLLQAAWSRRRAFELRMQMLELIELAVRRQLPLVPMLRRAAFEHRRGTARAFTRLARDLESGEDLVEALVWAAPMSFPPHVRATIGAAGGSGELAPVLAGLVAQTDESMATTHRMSMALLYPLTLVLGVMFVREAVMQLYRGGGGMFGSASPTADWWSLAGWFPRLSLGRGPLSPWLVVAMGVTLTLVVATSVWRSRTFLRRLVLDALAQIPWRPRSSRDLVASRFLLSLSHLVAAGHPLPAAIRSARGAAGSRRMETRIERAAEALEAGHPPVDAWPLAGLPATATASISAASRADATQFAACLHRTADSCRERFVMARERFLDTMHPLGVILCGLVLAADLTTLFSMNEYVRRATNLW